MTAVPIPEVPVHVVQSADDARLQQLHAAYATAKAAKDEASKRLDAIVAALKVEMTQRAPEGAEKIRLAGDAGPVLALSYSRRTSVNTRKLKRLEPDVWARYAEEGGSWSLRTVEGGEE